jgi:hypothetical protein
MAVKPGGGTGEIENGKWKMGNEGNGGQIPTAWPEKNSNYLLTHNTMRSIV